MYDPIKIKLMAKIAIHEKQNNAKDNKICENYRSDYIYKRNAISRISVLIGLFLIAILVVIDIIFVKQIDIFTIDYVELGIIVAVVVGLVLGLYTVIGIFKYGKEYDLAEKRLKKYYSMLTVLDKHFSEKNPEIEKETSDV